MEPLILTDEEIMEAFGNSNFGPGVITPQQRRQFIARTLFQYSCGYQSGYTIQSICRDLGLTCVPKNRITHLTTKGRKFMRQNLKIEGVSP